MIDARNLGGDVECAFVNSFQMRWAIPLAQLGIPAVLGKTMLWRRATLDRVGGHAAISRPADDVAAGAALARVGPKPQLAKPVYQRAGARRLGAVVQRQIRWGRTGRMEKPWLHGASILGANTLPFWLILLAFNGGLSTATSAALIVGWYAAEMAFTRLAGWQVGWRTPTAFLVRDVLIIPIWLSGWIRRDVRWHGHTLSSRK